MNLPKHSIFAHPLSRVQFLIGCSELDPLFGIGYYYVAPNQVNISASYTREYTTSAMCIARKCMKADIWQLLKTK